MAQFFKVIGPAYWASYFVDGDASGLTDSEKRKADKWLARKEISNVVDCGEPFFTWHFDLYSPEHDCKGGEVVEYTAVDH
jgi:hypothetical protein